VFQKDLFYIKKVNLQKKWKNVHQFLVPSKSVINAAKSEYFSLEPSNCATKSSIELSFFVNVVLT